MKKLFWILTGIVYVLSSTNIPAQDVAPLGNGNLALKFDYFVFTDGYFGDSEDAGLYIGLEGYGKIASYFYLGGEIGQAATIVLFGDNINFVPIEVNVKYARELAQNLVVDFGAGISYSYVALQHYSFWGPDPEERDDWLFGGQIFADLSYKINWFSIGINSKYQITQSFKYVDLDSFKDEDLAISNFRFGLSIGIIFK